MASFKVESGIQLLARLRRRPDVQSFYPILFESGPKPGEVIEIIFSEENPTFLLIDLICKALMPLTLGGLEAGVLLFNTDGNMSLRQLENTLRRKLLSQIASTLEYREQYTDENINQLLQTTFGNFHVLDIYDATHMYTTLYNLDSILAEHPNIALIVFDTLTAFFWSEQGFKITKMDLYLKNLLRTIQKVTNEYKITVIFTRPEYFSSSKDTFENLEKCSDQPALEQVNYRIQLLPIGDSIYQVNVQSCSKFYKKSYIIIDNEIKWS